MIHVRVRTMCTYVLLCIYVVKNFFADGNLLWSGVFYHIDT